MLYYCENSQAKPQRRKRNATIIFALIFFSLQIVSAQTHTYTPSDPIYPFICPDSIKELLQQANQWYDDSIFYNYSEDNEPEYKADKNVLFKALLECNPLAFVDADQYNTPLKRKHFLQSQEYKELLIKVKGLRDSLLKTEMNLSCIFGISDYNLKEKGFNLSIVNNSAFLNVLDGILFNQLAMRKVISPATMGRIKNGELSENPKSSHYSPICNDDYVQQIFIPISNESDALEIEKDKDNLKLLLFYRINGFKQINGTRRKSIEQFGDSFLTRSCETTNDTVLTTTNYLRFALLNDSLKKVYYDK